MMRHRFLTCAAAVVALVLTLGACSTGVKTLGNFEDVVNHDNRYSCEELIEIAEKLDASEREKAQARLSGIGCTSPAATRTDR